MFGLLFFLVFLLNFLLTPVAIFGVISVPMMQIALALNLPPETFVYAIIHSAETVIFPYEYLPYLIVYSFGMMSMKDFVKVSVIRCTIYIIGFFAILVPYWMLIGLV